MRKKLKRAIEIIEDSRRSHLECILNPESETTGTPDFHKRCIDEYQQVLEVLLSIDG